MSNQTSAQRSVRAVIRQTIAPAIDAAGLPYCTEACPQHDGKRCRVIGNRPSSICEPAMEDMAAVIESAAMALGIKP